MENNKNVENSKLEVDCVDEESAKKCGALLGVNNPDSVNVSNKQHIVLSSTGDKCSRNEINSEANVDGASKSQKNVKEKSQIQRRQSKKRNLKSKALSFGKIDEKDTENTKVENKMIQRKITRKSVAKQNNELLPSKPITCLPSTSSALGNSCSRRTEVDKTKKCSNESSQCDTSAKPNCGPSSKNSLGTLFPHVGLPYFPDSSKATPVPRISNESKLPKLKSKTFSLAVDKIKQAAKMTPESDRLREFLPLSAGPKSPEPKKRKSENVVRESQYPQPLKGKSYPDAVFDPPLANPGTMVGFTPAGQRFEVDLNLDRPTWFSSEYARMQFDDATKINVSRMIHDMESGSFLPAQLDTNVEQCFKSELNLFKEESTEILKELRKNSVTDTPLNVSKTDLEEHKRRLNTEDELIDLVLFVMLRHKDFPLQVSEKLKSGLNMKLTPLMFKKHPVLLECIEELCDSSDYLEVTQPAQTFLDKIKGLFNVPDTQTFDDYFESQVASLKDATEHMNLLELLSLTDEPDKEPSDGSSGKPNEALASDSDPRPSKEGEVSESGGEDEWIPVDNNDESFVDIEGISEELDQTTDGEGDNETVITESELSDDDEDMSSIEDEESESEDEELLQFIILDAINGMLFHGYPGYTIIDFFDYI